MTDRDMLSRLKKLGFDPGPKAGTEQATEALKTFQRRHELQVTGEMNPETEDTLRRGGLEV